MQNHTQTRATSHVGKPRASARQRPARPGRAAAASTLRHLIDISCSRQGIVLDPVFTGDHLYQLIHCAACTQAVTFCGELALRARSSIWCARTWTTRPGRSDPCRFGKLVFLNGD